ncbi:unnamed protein product [Microthlaspi erraticum]|uniref:Uncharacterized protein n=1 Tax=Microthlaspi erraticum TaxID=1685480 RepID=A0A6D2KGH7_9BRAS|nr:unnamed protein product [Microthlaspi erraticum]
MDLTVYDEDMKRHIERVEAYSYCDGIMRWDEVMWEQVVALRAENEKQEKHMRQLQGDIVQNKREIEHLKAQLDHLLNKNLRELTLGL